jgi:hypothetical protein
MKARLLSRLERLESRSEMAKPALFRYGWLKPLPGDYQGERHVALLKSEPTLRPQVRWCEFEERPGAAPAGVADNSFMVYILQDRI